MPAYRMPGIPEEEPRPVVVLPWVEIGRRVPRGFTGTNRRVPVTGPAGVMSLTRRAPGAAGPRCAARSRGSGRTVPGVRGPIRPDRGPGVNTTSAHLS